MNDSQSRESSTGAAGETGGPSTSPQTSFMTLSPPKTKRDANTTTAAAVGADADAVGSSAAGARPSRLHPSEPLHMTTRARAQSNSSSTSSVVGRDNCRISFADQDPAGQDALLPAMNDERPRKRRRSTNTEDSATSSPGQLASRTAADLDMVPSLLQDSSTSQSQPQSQTHLQNGMDAEFANVKRETPDDNDAPRDDLAYRDQHHTPGKTPHADYSLTPASDRYDVDQQDDQAEHNGLESSELPLQIARDGLESLNGDMELDRLEEEEDEADEADEEDEDEDEEEEEDDDGDDDDDDEEDDDEEEEEEEDDHVTKNLKEVASRLEADSLEQSIETFQPTTRLSTSGRPSVEASVSSTNPSPGTTPALGPVDDDLAMEYELAMPLLGDDTKKLGRRLPGRRRAPHPDPAIEADLRRQLQLRMAYRSVAKALKPILAEIADRSVTSVEKSADAHTESEQYELVTDDLDVRLEERLAVLNYQYELQKEYYQKKRDSTEAYLNSMFSNHVQTLKDDYVARCQYKLLELSREMDEQSDSDVTEDEDGIVPRRQGYTYPFSCTGPLPPEYDSRSRMFLETENLVKQYVARYSSEGSRKKFLQKNMNEYEDSIGDIAATFGAFNREQREYAIAVLNADRLIEAAEELERFALGAQPVIIPNEDATALQLLASASEGTHMRPPTTSATVPDAVPARRKRGISELVAEGELPPTRRVETSEEYVPTDAVDMNDESRSRPLTSIASHSIQNPALLESSRRYSKSFLIDGQRVPVDSRSSAHAKVPLEMHPEAGMGVSEHSISSPEPTGTPLMRVAQSSTTIGFPRASSARIMDLLNEDEPKDASTVLIKSSPASTNLSLHDLPPGVNSVADAIIPEAYNRTTAPVEEASTVVDAERMGKGTVPFWQENHADRNLGKAFPVAATSLQDAQALRHTSLTPSNTETGPVRARHSSSNFWSTVASPDEYGTSREVGQAQTPIDRVRRMVRKMSDSSAPRRLSGSPSVASPLSAYKALSQTPPPAKHGVIFGGPNSDSQDPLVSLNPLHIQGQDTSNALNVQSQDPPGIFSSSSNELPRLRSIESSSQTLPLLPYGSAGGSPRPQYTMPPLSSITQGIPTHVGSSWANSTPSYGPQPPPSSTGFASANGSLPPPSTATSEHPNAPVPVDPALLSSHAGYQGYPPPHSYGQPYGQGPQYHPQYAGSPYHNSQPPYGSPYHSHYGNYSSQQSTYRSSLPAQQGSASSNLASGPPSQAASPVSEGLTPPNAGGPSRPGPPNTHQRSSSGGTPRPPTAQAVRPPSTSVPAGYNSNQYGKQLLPANDARSPPSSIQPTPGPTQQPPKPLKPALGPIMVEKELPKKRHRQYSHVPGTVFRGYTGPKPNNR